MRCRILLLLAASTTAVARVAPEPPVITPAPALDEAVLRRADIDPASLAMVLATGVPPSILALALTNVQSVSRLLWSEFLDDNTPAWFTALPTNVQEYLSGEFGPASTTSRSSSKSSTTTAAPSSVATTSSATPTPTSDQSQAANDQSESSDDDSDSGGLPLWAKIVIGVLVPVVVLGLIALLVLCCLRRRRRRRRHADPSDVSRGPTPAMRTNSYNNAYPIPAPERQSLRGKHMSDYSDTTLRSSHPNSSGPIGGPGYEDTEPAGAVAGNHRSHRSSRQSFGSLHSVPEMPEPMHAGHHSGPGAMIPPMPPPRSPRRSRDLMQENRVPPEPHNMQQQAPVQERRHSIPRKPVPSHNPELLSKPASNEATRHSPEDYGPNSYWVANPFVDPASPRDSRYSAGNGHRSSFSHQREPFLQGHEDRRHSMGNGYGGGFSQHHQPAHEVHPAYRQQHEDFGSDWPLRGPPAGNGGYGAPRW